MTVSYAEPKPSADQPADAPKPSKAIYVGGLPPGATDEALKEIFSKFGEVSLDPCQDECCKKLKCRKLQCLSENDALCSNLSQA